MTTRHEYMQRAEKLFWFNAVDFGDFQSRGRDKPDAPAFNASLFGTYDLLGSIDLKGKRCLDIGAGSGVVALGMKALGAEYVAAVDAIESKALQLAAEITGEKIDYRVLGVERLSEVPEWRHSFDVVVSSGLMYHLWSPFELVFIAKRLLKNEGLFILQTLTYPNDDNKAGMYLNSAKNVNGDPTTYWVPSVAAVKCMLRASCFDVVAQRDLTYKAPFVAWLSRAKDDPSAVPGRPKNLAEMHEKATKTGFNFGGYELADMIEPAPKSDVSHNPIPEYLKLDEATYDCRFPYNPKKLSNPYGVVLR